MVKLAIELRRFEWLSKKLLSFLDIHVYGSMLLDSIYCCVLFFYLNDGSQ